ncbi:hypothetical protein [Daejeonella sp.]|uniref:hypothetical protein n=1 Tax=Daejeonella sp. TaxID=2805397 RepID=UPI0039835ED5
MKIFKSLIPALSLIASCQSEPTQTASSIEKAENMDHEKTLVLPWNAQINDSTHRFEIKREPAANMTNLQPEDIVDAINLKYPEIKLIWVKLEGTKAYVSIVDATYLTQRAGSDGAQAYLAEATYSLTELEGIVEVEFSFKEGDHARPGIYKRSNFKF